MIKISQSLYGGQFTLSTQLIKPNYLVILPPTQHHSFFRSCEKLDNNTSFSLHIFVSDIVFMSSSGEIKNANINTSRTKFVS